MASDEEILSMIRIQGPSIPVQISKKIGQNILFSSAILGELASKGKLKISNVKIGGTPLYYLPGQESKLQEYSKYLGTKEQRVYELLKENKILRDKEQEPLVRVILRTIKDYAIPLEVSHNSGSEMFWKWYLLGKEEAAQLINKILDPVGSSKKEETKAEKSESENTEKVSEPIQPKEEPKVEKIVVEKSEIVKEETKKEKSISEKKPTVEKKLAKNVLEEEQEVLTEKPAPISGDEFSETLYSYFKKKEIEVTKQELIRKGSDMEFVISIPSSVGSIKYFVKARSKKNSNDGDLSSAFLQGQRKNLPVIYLTTGKVTKKGKETAKKEFPSMIIDEI